MKWINHAATCILTWLNTKRHKRLPQVTLDGYNNRKVGLTFPELNDIRLEYLESDEHILLYLKGKKPKKLPATKVNVDFVALMTPYMEHRTKKNKEICDC